MPERSNTERALGIVIGKLEDISQRLDRQDESRARLHQEVNELVMRMTYIEADMGSVKKKVENQEEITVKFSTIKTQAEGMGTLGRWILRAGVWVVTVGGWLVAVYTYLTGRPPP